MHTFVVRIAPATDPDDAWHGVVRRVADGHEEAFHGADQLLALMRTGAAPPPDDGPTGAGPVQRA